MASDTRESFTEEVTFDLNIAVCGKGQEWGRTRKQRRSVGTGKGL